MILSRCKWLITLVMIYMSPKDRVFKPLPNGHSLMANKWGGDPDHLLGCPRNLVNG